MTDNFPVLFTGREVSYTPRTTGELERSTQRFHDKYLKGQEVQRADRLRGEEFFYKTSDIDPVQLSSDFLAQLQEEDLNDFNNKWAKVMGEQGTLTQSQKSQMFRERKAMEAKQANWLASQQRFERDYEMMRRDAARSDSLYDRESFLSAADNFMKTGEYQGGLRFSPIHASTFFMTDKGFSGTEKWTRDQTQVGQTLRTEEVKTRGTIEEAEEYVQARIDQDMENNGRLLMGIIKEFQAEAEEVKSQYLIIGEIDTPEEENAIIRYAKDKYAPMLIRSREVKQRAPDRSATSRTSSTRDNFDVYESVSGEFVEPGQGIEFGETKPIDVQVSKLELPEGMEIANTSVKVYPVVAANGKIEFRVDPRNIKVVKRSKSSGDAYRATGKVPQKDADGFYVWEEKLPEGTRVAARVADVANDLNTHYGSDRFNTLINRTFPEWLEEDPDDIYLEK